MKIQNGKSVIKKKKSRAQTHQKNGQQLSIQQPSLS